MVAMQDVVDAFDMLEDWEARYEYIGELARELTPLRSGEKTDANLVPGCNTRTWLIASLDSARPAVLHYRAEGEGPLVNGLVAVLLAPFQDRSPEEIVATDPSDYLDRLGLVEQLSPTRRVGLYHFIDRVKAIAREAGATSEQA